MDLCSHNSVFSRLADPVILWNGKRVRYFWPGCQDTCLYPVCESGFKRKPTYAQICFLHRSVGRVDFHSGYGLPVVQLAKRLRRLEGDFAPQLWRTTSPNRTGIDRRGFSQRLPKRGFELISHRPSTLRKRRKEIIVENAFHSFGLGLMRFVTSLLLLSCAGTVAGCAAPKRTFVSENDLAAARASRRTKPVDGDSPKPVPRVTSPSSHTDPNQPARSVWSKWLGAFSGNDPQKETAKAPQRIPLPRTDQNSKNSDGSREAEDSSPFGGF